MTPSVDSQLSHQPNVTEPCALILTNSSDATSDYLCQRLIDGGIRCCRFDTDTALGTLRISCDHGDERWHWDGGRVERGKVAAVVLRRPKPVTPLIAGDPFQVRHAAGEWSECIEGLLAGIPLDRWINHPVCNAAASHKIEQLRHAQEVGLLVPDWIVTTEPSIAREFVSRHDFDVIVKPLASGYIEREAPAEDTLIYTSALERSMDALVDLLPGCPVLFQMRVEKRTDVRLVVVGGGMTAVSLHAADPGGCQRLDVRRNNMADVKHQQVAVPESVAIAVHRMIRGYGLQFAALDFAITPNDEWVFFEVNPNGQWAWLDLVGAADIGSAFVAHTQSLFGHTS